MDQLKVPTINSDFGEIKPLNSPLSQDGQYRVKPERIKDYPKNQQINNEEISIPEEFKIKESIDSPDYDMDTYVDNDFRDLTDELIAEVSRISDRETFKHLFDTRTQRYLEERFSREMVTPTLRMYVNYLMRQIAAKVNPEISAKWNCIIEIGDNK